MDKLTLYVIFVVGITSFPDFSAAASSCKAHQTATDPAVKMLQRQLSALRAIERGRGCKPSDAGGGLFNACREVGLNIREVQQELDAASVIDRECRTGNRSTASVTKWTHGARTPSSTGRARSGSSTDNRVKKAGGVRNSLQFCVRLSDGYYFRHQIHNSVRKVVQLPRSTNAE